jgi:hypothetical protein
MSTISVNGVGVTQESVTLTQDTWVSLAVANQQRMYLEITNTSAAVIYLYMGTTAPVAVDGTVAFKALAAKAAASFDSWQSNCHHGIFRGKIWGLCVGAAGTAVVGEW